MLGGSTTLVKQAEGIYSGDLSGIVTKTIPWWAKLRYFPPEDLALLSKWEEKIEKFADAALREDIRLISGVPSWMLILFDRLRALTGKERLVEIFPNLELLVHGGIKFDPYRDLFEDILQGSHAETREVYVASEGFIAIQDRNYNEGMVLLTNHEVFYEFVPVEELESANPARHWVKNIEPGVNYAVVLSTAAGLWSYVLGDTVRFVEVNPPRLLVTGRTAYMLSAFGEHLIEEELSQAVAYAAQKLGLHVNDFSVAPIFPATSSELGRHKYLIECHESGVDKDTTIKFISLLDEKLIKLNEDYQAHRADSFGLKAPEVHFVPAGTFAGWMKSRGKLGGQNKVPRVILDGKLFESLESFAAA